MAEQADLHKVPFAISWRDVKYPRLEFRTGTLLLVLPTGEDAAMVLDRHRHWIDRKYQFIDDVVRESQKYRLEFRSKEELRRLVLEYTDNHSQDIGFVPGKVNIRKMKTKWASCSKQGNITVNSLVQYLPQRLIDYIVYHEMVHLIHRRHDEMFWKYIRNTFPDADELERALCIYWFVVQREQ